MISSGGLIGFLITLLVLVVVFGLVSYLIKVLALPEPYAHWAQVLLIVIVVLYLLGCLLGRMPLVPLRF